MLHVNKEITSLVDGLENHDNEPDLAMTHLGVSLKLLLTMQASNGVVNKWRGFVQIKPEAEMNKANEPNESIIYQMDFSIICFSEGY